MSSSSDLIAKLEGADKGGRELDEAIARWLGWTQHSDEGDPVYVGKISLWWAEPGETDWSSTSVHPPHYTTSLDAALALVEERLPGWMVAVAGPWTWAAHTERAGQPIWRAEIVRCTEESGVGYREVNDLEHKAPTPALAVLIALLKALDAVPPTPADRDHEERRMATPGGLQSKDQEHE